MSAASSPGSRQSRSLNVVEFRCSKDRTIDRSRSNAGAAPGADRKSPPGGTALPRRLLFSRFTMERIMGSTWTRYSYGWVTLGFFVISLVGHWLFGWFAYVDEQNAHGQPIEVPSYLVEMTRDTLENWQSEFLQLLWQVGGLAFLLFLGSPQSKEGHDRI